MTTQEWTDAIQRAKQGAPPVPNYDTGQLKKDGTVGFSGWHVRIGGLFPQNLGFDHPLEGADLSDIQYLGFLRRVVGNKMYAALIPGDYAAEAMPGSSFEVKSDGFKLGQFTQEEVDVACAAAEKRLIEVSAQS